VMMEDGGWRMDDGRQRHALRMISTKAYVLRTVLSFETFFFIFYTKKDHNHHSHYSVHHL